MVTLIGFKLGFGSSDDITGTPARTANMNDQRCTSRLRTNERSISVPFLTLKVSVKPICQSDKVLGDVGPAMPGAFLDHQFRRDAHLLELLDDQFCLLDRH